jgi:hypothetical protein
MAARVAIVVGEFVNIQPHIHNKSIGGGENLLSVNYVTLHPVGRSQQTPA